MKKYILFLILLNTLIVTALFSGTQQLSWKDNSVYSEITAAHSDDFIYEFSDGYPLMPAAKKTMTLPFRAELDSFSIMLSEPETLYIEAVPGQTPQPLSFSPEKRSSISIKGMYPDYNGDIASGYSGNETRFSIRANNYVWTSQYIIHYRNIDVTIFYTEVPYWNIKGTPSMLILTVDSLKTEWDQYKAIYPEVNVITASAGDVNSLYPALDIEEATRTYIQSLYADSALKAVMISTDTDQFPPIYVYMPFTTQLDSVSQVVITDRYYSNLDGNWDADGDGIPGEINDSVDLYPDILISRVPMRNSTDIANFISKINTLRTTGGDTMLFVASYLDANTNGAVSMDNIIDILNIDDPVRKIYEMNGNLSSYTFIEAMNNSPFMVSHDGHGNASSIQSGSDYTTMYNLDTLRNDIPMLFYSLSCWSAAFDNDCVAEHFLRAPNGGGFYVGNARYGWYTPYFPGFGTGDLINIDFFDKMLNVTSNPAEALNMSVADYAYEASRLNDYRWASFVLTYFGDPLINVNRGIHFPDISYQTPYKNGHFSMTLPTDDSTYVTCVSDGGTEYAALYSSNNLFSISTDSSDSLMIHIRSNAYNDTSFTVFQDNTGSKCYLDFYSADYISADSIDLALSMKPAQSGSFNINPVSIPDTFEYSGDSSFTLSGDTTLHFMIYAPLKTPRNFGMDIRIDDDTLFIQPGNDMRKCFEINIETDRAHYAAPDTIFAEIAVSNISSESYSDIMIIAKSDSLAYIDTLYSGPVNAEAAVNSSISVPVLLSDIEAADMEIIVKNNLLETSREYFVSTNSSNVYFDCEAPGSFSVDSSAAYFHISGNRSASGSYSYFSGLATTASYPSNYTTILTSEPFTYDTTKIFGFSTYYDTEAGFDYCLVILTSDTIDVPVVTFSGNSGGWLNYTFNPRAYEFLIGRSVNLMFAFYSEADAVLGEGWYIDDIVLPANETAMMIHENPFSPAPENEIPGIRMLSTVTNGKLFFSIKGNEKLPYTIYDISGRAQDNGYLSSAKPFINVNLKSGKYFITMPGYSSIFTILK